MKKGYILLGVLLILAIFVVSVILIRNTQTKVDLNKEAEGLRGIRKGVELNLTSIAYTNNNITIELKDSKNIIIGKVTLKSHKTYDEILKITTGKNRTIIWYEFSDFKDIYQDALGEVEFIDMREIIENKSYTKQFEENPEGLNESLILINNPDYLLPINKTYHFVYKDERGEWTDYNSKEIPKENITIGVQADLFWGEFLDIRFNILGNKLDRHALVLGTNCGFVTSAPTADPEGNNISIESYAWAIKVTSPSNIQNITRIGYWLDTDPSSVYYQVGIYSHDSINDRPDELLVFVESNVASPGWKYRTFNLELTPDTIYWLAVQFDTATPDPMINNDTGDTKTDYKSEQSSLPSTWGISNGSSNQLLSIYALYTEIQPDSTPPYFTSIPANTSINYTQGSGVDFDATDETGFGTYTTNWTALFTINSSGWLTNSTSNTAVGNYYINVTINDTSDNLNSTIYFVNVSKATSSLGLTATTPITYPTATDFTESGCPSQLSCSLNISNGVYSAGTISANYSTAGNTNYTGSSAIFTITINQASSQTSLTFDKTSPQVYETTITPTCSLITGVGSVSLTNGTSGNPQTLGVGNWTFNCSYTGNTNYTASSNLSIFNITKATPSLSLTATTPITYGTITDFAGSSCPAQLSCSLNISNRVFGAGIVNANYSTEGNENYTADSVDFGVTINKNSLYTLSISGTTPIDYGTMTNVVGSDCPAQLSCSLNQSNAVYPAGTQNFNYSTAGNTNYTAKSITISIVILPEVTISEGLCSDFLIAGMSFTGFIALIVCISAAGIVFVFLTSDNSDSETDFSAIIIMIIVGAIIIIIGATIINAINKC